MPWPGLHSRQLLCNGSAGSEEARAWVLNTLTDVSIADPAEVMGLTTGPSLEKQPWGTQLPFPKAQPILL